MRRCPARWQRCISKRFVESRRCRRVGSQHQCAVRPLRSQLEQLHEPPAYSSTPSVRPHIDMPKASDRRFVAVWIGGEPADRNDAWAVVSCEEQFTGSVETLLAFLPLADEALDEVESFVNARR